MERMFGLETEYALGGSDIRGNRGKMAHLLMETAKGTLPCIVDPHSGGLFLGNGARVYIDVGHHPEFTTPECTNPWDVVRYVQAGEQILTNLVSDLERMHFAQTSGIMLFRCNIDYSGANTTWGCHESYLHRASPEAMRKHIIPHLVSRIIYTGAGGFDPSFRGIRFLVSPRVVYLEHEASSESTSSRGIYHTKDETLCSDNGYHRLHVICGESLCSELGTFLKVGVTALVVAMIEANLQPANGVRLRSPLKAMQRFTRDTQCVAQADASCRDVGLISALEIQRHYLGLAEQNCNASFMPLWAPQVCEAWKAILDEIEEGAPSSVNTKLDWAIKYSLYELHIHKRGFSWQSIDHWNYVVDRLRTALNGIAEFRDRPVEVSLVLGDQSPIAQTVRDLTSYVNGHGLSWNQLPSFLNLRQELFELDIRFGQLGENGIFSQMSRAEVLDHHFPGVDNIEHALMNPPAMGRARLRGEWVQKLAGHSFGRYLCGWQFVADHANRQLLDLGDPWETQTKWRPWFELFPNDED